MTTTIAFCDFWTNFNPETTWFYPILKENFDVKLVDAKEDPDILFYSCFGTTHLFTEAKIKVYFTGENDVPDFNQCDYAISFHHLNFGARHLRLPLYAFYPAFDLLRTNRRSAFTTHRGFCSFVVSNDNFSDPIRTEFFHRLSEYKHVSSGGRHLNNIGHLIENKHSFLEQYKFNIAFENSSVDGYTTEKLFDAFGAGTLPIYWGNPSVTIDANPKSFINISNFSTISDAIEHIIEVDKNDDLYKGYMMQNPIQDNTFIEWEKIFVNFLQQAIEYKIRQLPLYGKTPIDYQVSKHKERLYNIRHIRNNIDKIERLVKLKTNLKDSISWNH